MRLQLNISQKLLPLLILCTPMSQAFAEAQHPYVEDTNRIASSLLTVLNQCPDRIWPKLAAAHVDYVLVNNELSRQILISPSKNKISTIANEALPNHVFSTAFSLVNFENRDVVFADSQYGRIENSKQIYGREVPNRAFMLAVHEAFHMIDQKGWVRKVQGARGTSIPMLSAPRIARHMLYRSLLNAYNDKSQASVHLGKAKYWYDRWLEADASEGASSTDGYEGTARYVDVIATALDERGCGTTEQELEQVVTNNWLFNGLNTVGFSSLDSEGYYIGGMAGLILRFQYPNKNWQARMVTGETPLEVLLENILPIPDVADQIFKDKIIASIQTQSLEIDKNLSSVRAQLQKESTLYISVPNSAVQVFYPKGFYIDRATGMRFIPLGKDLEFFFANKGAKLTAKINSVYLQTNDSSPCQKGFIFAVDQSEVKSVNKYFYFHSYFSELTGEFKAETKTDSKGRPWLCLEE